MKDYTPHQKKIIKRYYDNLGDISLQRLAELTTEIYLAEGKKADRLWEQAAKALAKSEIPQGRIDHILQSRDPKLLGALVQELSGK